MKMKIIRVFPRKTSATPDDADVRIKCQPGLFDEADEIHIPVIWTYDLPVAEKLEKLWRQVAPVRMGGPAFDDPGGEFVPGMYVKHGYVMTSSGCPNRCWFCSVWRREGGIREIGISEGYNLLDSNILACSDDHIKAVFKMLAEGKKKFRKPVEFTGGLEAARLKQWHVDALRELRPKQLFFAYDTPDDLEPLIEAGKMLHAAGFTATSHCLRAYVLCGFKGDSHTKASKRMEEAMIAGFIPMAMLYRDKEGKRDPAWTKWARLWARMAIINSTRGTK
jgi:hypothetical protein